MDYRLGEYECPQCGKTAAREVREETVQPSGPGFRREAWHRPQAAPGAERAVTPEARQDLEVTPVVESTGHRVSGLELEKRVYFGIALVVAAIGVLESAVGAVLHGGGFGWLLGSIFWEAVVLFLLAYVLFSGETWIKGCCAALVVLELLSMIGVAYFTIPYLSQAVGTAGVLPGFITLPFWIGFAIHAAWNGWLLSILWRDHAGG
jgi:hypothetical protein